MAGHWFKLCPRCDGQGRLFIVRDCSTGRLYLHCEECEYGFRNPEACANISDGFLAVGVRYDTPTQSEIEANGWRRYAKHEMPE